MTTAADIFSRIGVDTVTDDRARRAVKAGHKLLPTLTSYARVLTKRSDVRVVMSASIAGATDGKKIFWRPPIALGDSLDHERRFCDKRDDRLQPLCPACKAREDVLTVIYHEIAHICFESFARVSEADKKSAVQAALKESGSEYSQQVQQVLETSPRWKTEGDYINLAGLISPYLPLLVNALEDARVNRELFKARKGVKQMFDASVRRVFEEGVEQPDPATGKTVTVMWNEYALNMQVLVGLFAKACGYDYQNYFVTSVVTALNDQRITELVNQLNNIRTSSGVYNLGFPVLERLRELGFCENENLPDEPEEERDESGQPEDGDPSDSSDESPEGSPSDVDSDGNSEMESEAPEREDDSEEPESESSSNEGSDSGSEGSDSDGDKSGQDDTYEGDDSDDVPDPDSEDVGSSSGLGDEDAEDGQNGNSDGEPVSSGDDSSSGTDSSEPQQTADTEFGSGDIEGDSLDDPRDPEQRDGDDDSDFDREESSSVNSGESSGISTGDDSIQADSGSSNDQPDSGDSSESSDSSSGDNESGDLSSGSDSPVSQDSGEPEPIDTGAADKYGGTELIEDESNDSIPMGTPEEAEQALKVFGGHDEKPETVQETRASEAIDRAIVQGIYFETPSKNIWGVREHFYGEPLEVDGYNMSQAWDETYTKSYGLSRSRAGIDGEFEPSETTLGPALLRMRVAFSNNKRAKDREHLKSGKVNARVLGRRAWQGDERVFRSRVVPGKRDYFVAIAMDVSGSTAGVNLVLEKRAVMAQAELCSRMGIQFAIYAYSGNLHAPREGRAEGMDLDIYLVKEPNEPWNEAIKTRLRDLGPDSANLDGHTLEYLRKICDRRQETDKIIMYYSDGKMPAENRDEELVILQREIKNCRQKGYTLLGVGIRTDSPTEHGLETVEVNNDEDIVKVVKFLEKKLLKNG